MAVPESFQVSSLSHALFSQQARLQVSKMGSGSRLALLVQHSFRRISSTSTANPLPPQQEKLYSGAAIGTCSFEADLAARAQQLQLQTGGGSAHLNWLIDASACTLSTHSSLASLLIHTPSSTQEHPSPDPYAQLNSQLAAIPRERADEVLSFLDVCISLQHMAEDAERQLGRLQRALHIAGQALRMPHMTRAKIQAAAHRLRSACHQLDVNASKHSRDAAHAALNRSVHAAAPALSTSDLAALDGTLLISLLVLTSTLSTFSAPTSSAMRSTCKLIARYCSRVRSRATVGPPLWAAPLQRLQRDLRREEMGAVFLELQGLHSSSASLLASMTADQLDSSEGVQVLQMRQGVDSLRKRAQEAQACLCCR
ncbi:hypothetical protein GOP47_0028021 [Adiantum capillus-veneris]|nr:hypothetical protein GOP47_0028021 [Adiantum capillus-veneris]